MVTTRRCVALAQNDMEMYPERGMSGALVSLSAPEISTSSIMYCRFGKLLVVAQRNFTPTARESTIICRVPRQTRGFHSVEVTHNGRDFTNSGLIFHHIDIIITDAFPKRVHPDGGTLVTVTGGRFQDDFVCLGKTNSVAVKAAFLSSSLLVCESTAPYSTSSLGIVMSIATSGITQSMMSEMIDLHPVEVNTTGSVWSVDPNEPHIGELIIEGTGFDVREHSRIWCKFGSFVIIGRIYSSTRCSCRPPFTQNNNNTPLYVSSNLVDYSPLSLVSPSSHCLHDNKFAPLLSIEEHILVRLRGHPGRYSCDFDTFARPSSVNVHACSKLNSAFGSVETLSTPYCARVLNLIEVRQEPSLSSVFPSSAAKCGGSLHVVTGVDFGIGPMCKFNDLLQPGHGVSSALTFCEAPSSDEFDGSWILQLGVYPYQTDFRSGGIILEVVRHPVIRDVSPIFGLTDGGISLQIMANIPLNLSSSSFVCQLSTISYIAARSLSGNMIECITPARHASQADVGVSTGSTLETWSFHFLYIGKLALVLGQPDSIDRTTSIKNTMRNSTIDIFEGDVLMMATACGLTAHREHATREIAFREGHETLTPALEILASPIVSNAFPTTVQESGGLVMLAGQDFSADTVIISGTWTIGHFISSVLIFLDIKAGSAGDEVVLLESGTTSLSQGKQLVYENDATVFSLHPLQGTLAGGTLLTVVGEKFVNSRGLSCVVGTFAPLSARWLGSNTLHCVTPAHREILIGVSITNVSPVFARESVNYRYRLTEPLIVGTKLSELEFWKTDYYESLTGECADDHELSNQMIHHGKSDMVLFDLTRVTSTNACGIPRREVGFSAAVIDASAYNSIADIQYIHILGPSIRAIMPHHVETRRQHPIWILGKHFSTAVPFCVTEDERSNGFMVSSAILICELSDHVEGDVQVSVGPHSGTSNIGVVTYESQIGKIEVIPHGAPESGGTVVSISTQFARISPVQCKFGTVGTLFARIMSPGLYQCVTPARLSGIFRMALSTNSFGPASTAIFEYQSSLIVSDIFFLKSVATLPLCHYGNDVDALQPVIEENSFYYIHSKNLICRPSSVMARGFTAVLAFGPSYSMPPQFTQSQFLVSQPVVTTNAFPTTAVACGGTLLHVSGRNIIKSDFGTPHCVFGSEARQAHVISSSFAMCEVPAAESHYDASAFVEVSLLSLTLSSSFGKAAQHYVRVAHPMVHHLVPQGGPSRGGTASRVQGSTFSDTLGLSCIFGSTRVQASYVSDEEIICLSPSSGHVIVPLGVSVNGRDHFSSVHQFKYS